MDDDDEIPLSQAMGVGTTSLIPPSESGIGNGGGPPGTSGANAAPPGLQFVEEKTEHGKVFNDPVHGHIRLSRTAMRFVDTTPFQRLRNLKQLGCTYFVFPGASHNRFEHSIGVGYKAFQMGYTVMTNQKLAERSDTLVLELAGLCHDLGHGPFSHVFDREILRAKGITNWEHEDMSCKVLDHIIDMYSIDCVAEQDVKRVKELISCHSAPPRSLDKKWMYEVVSNWRNGLDVDKFDYLERDSLYCGVRMGCDFDRLGKFYKVVDDQVCYKYSEWMNLYDVFMHRSKMHRIVYTHRKCKSIEFMVVDALLEADRALRLTDKIWDVSQFLRLDDTLLRTISNFELYVPDYAQREEYQPIVAASNIIQRLERRDLYRYVNEVLVPSEVLERGAWVAPSAQDIIDTASVQGDVRLRAEDLVVYENKIDFAAKAANPMDRVSFFYDFDSRSAFPLQPDQITNLRTKEFQEVKLRVVSKVSDPAYCKAVTNAFQRWVDKRFGHDRVPLGTPLRVSRKRARVLDFVGPA